MNGDEFDALARLTRAREPARSAARRVLVDGVRPSEAAAEFAMSLSSVSNAVTRYREFDAMIRSAYRVRR